jgi:hypothetical protein
MIRLAEDCLVFQMAGGENIPFSADMISVELMGESNKLFDRELVKHAAKAVFHYFKHERGRQTVTIAEFAEALEKVLHGFASAELPLPASIPKSAARVAESDLRRLACESGSGRELFFFPRLRAELREKLEEKPAVLRFLGLRGCVKQLMGAQRWTLACQDLEEQIVAYLRECLGAEARPGKMSILIQ